MEELANLTKTQIRKILAKDAIGQDESVTLVNLTIVLRNLESLSPNP
ncbi:hypothetical protein GNE08_26320 [Trichormus variabilis ARAD]|uniref:Uncharacterized protein n=1 Tax=Trichormus variabilis N2B TaxID=2681315 RepID=A0ABR6S8H0_ANAVA|nr:hypothetical protein [Trichormus variabilis]MBC1217714.1 hypothetical protein [Trichormus variabilis ARAD]MBC1258995.1 hypothetical protein [Trichormus variabilis V5]MBC1302706.1 hypothetical protein [Trichormus variabilis N2B]MBC1324561.1 hypothetical protein [Trichormus variabilis 9RC]MBC1324619.1 hypothetical protein [Trichormus variabilis 9RC]